jgi:putative membrane protein
MMWGYDYPAYWFGFIPGPLAMLISVFVLVFIFVWLMRWSFGGGHRHHRERSALDVLDERFARGEIDRKDYDERRKVLGG